MFHYLVGIGGSCPSRQFYMQTAFQYLRQHSLLKIEGRSAVYASQAMGGATDFFFLNAAAAICSPLLPDGFWLLLSSIEHRLGRCRFYPNSSRTLDLDVLWCQEYGIWPRKTNFLTLPHPQLLTRPFALNPGIEALKQAKWPIPLLLLEYGHGQLKNTPSCS